MDHSQSSSGPNLQTAIRTLLLVGFRIENNLRQPTHTEIYCSAPLLGTYVPLLLVLTDEDDLPLSVVPHILQAAKAEVRTMVVIANSPGTDQISWEDFMDRFGGAVPSWRALDQNYFDQLHTASQNRRPEGFVGEAWRLFESLVADGLEFVFGRRVRRLGAAKRGQRVSDMVAALPETNVLVIDAKATGGSFDAATHNLRALAEYTKNQRLRQRGFAEVFGAVVVARGFDQNPEALSNISREFVSEAGVPAAFLEVSVLVYMVETLRIDPTLRSGIKWRRLFSGGLLQKRMFDVEIEALKAERY